MSDEWPVIVKRPTADRIADALLYGIATPVIALPSGMIVGAFAGAGVYSLLGSPGGEHAPPLPALLAILLVGFTAGIATIVFVARRGLARWRVGRGRELRLWPDRIERDLGRSVEAWPYAEVKAVRFFDRGTESHGGSVRIELAAGRTLELRGEHWSLEPVREHIRATLVPILDDRIRHALADGEVVSCREPRAFAAALIFLGIMFAIWGVGLLGLLLTSLAGGKLDADMAPRAGYFALIFTAGGIAMIRFGLSFGGGGLAITSTGVRRVRDRPADEVPWREVQVHDEGDRIEIVGGPRTLRLTSYGENHPVLVGLLPSLAADARR
ncbi:MAG TPA: hypothetical protein VFF73_33870 [Planctomycetota bacterium]|nr:hypothetical protein [Planctomycetota bacterium]